MLYSTNEPYFEINDMKTARIPFLGCGTGGLKVEDVQLLYDEFLKTSSTTFYVVSKPSEKYKLILVIEFRIDIIDWTYILLVGERL